MDRTILGAVRFMLLFKSVHKGISVCVRQIALIGFNPFNNTPDIHSERCHAGLGQKYADYQLDNGIFGVAQIKVVRAKSA